MSNTNTFSLASIGPIRCRKYQVRKCLNLTDFNPGLVRGNPLADPQTLSTKIECKKVFVTDH